jgi:hypothetical protein
LRQGTANITRPSMGRGHGYARSWRLGPRLNAPGRMGDAAPALELLLTRDAAEAAPWAERIEQANEARRAAQEQMLGEAMRLEFNLATNTTTARKSLSVPLCIPVAVTPSGTELVPLFRASPARNGALENSPWLHVGPYSLVPPASPDGDFFSLRGRERW